MIIRILETNQPMKTDVIRFQPTDIRYEFKKRDEHVCSVNAFLCNFYCHKRVVSDRMRWDTLNICNLYLSAKCIACIDLLQTFYLSFLSIYTNNNLLHCILIHSLVKLNWNKEVVNVSCVSLVFNFIHVFRVCKLIEFAVKMK